MKANHNYGGGAIISRDTVSYGSKILKWKQITTQWELSPINKHCFLWFKDTKMKANHNSYVYLQNAFKTVSYGSKILKWKQITTLLVLSLEVLILFPMVQKYKNEKQITTEFHIIPANIWLFSIILEISMPLPNPKYHHLSLLTNWREKPHFLFRTSPLFNPLISPIYSILSFP